MTLKPRGRPKKIRQIEREPDIKQFSPRGKPGRPDEIELALDEYEAVRLADYEGLDYTESASRMQISRQTFGRAINQARHKIAEGIVKGKIIRIILNPESHAAKAGKKEEIPVKKAAQKTPQKSLKK